MSTISLNLSRKWRSQDFNQIVGQDLAVRILKNSLYLGHYFPVYLYAGQRGCGKTSTARIFAAAVNCYALPLFQKNPKTSSIPCLVCQSCIAMREGNHPDFIEIDAASHTGVDNIRSIIESSTLLPVMGNKRIYLIDEAHMLSKAAFNAALKILEEPPVTALFILATTNPHKIIDTVRSRCFQLFFMPVSHMPLKKHLIFICEQEKIIYADQALDLIIQHTEGSVRDALNLLEQVRFSHTNVNEDAVLSLLGYIDDQRIIKLIVLMIKGESKLLVELLHSLHIDNYKAEFIWQRMVILLRALLWIKYDVQPHELTSSIKLLEENASICTLNDVHRIIEALYIQEDLFLKTIVKNVFLEMVLLNICYNKDPKKNNNDSGAASCVLEIVPSNNNDCSQEEENNSAINENKVIDYFHQWQQFVSKVELINEPLVYSVFKQASFISYDIKTYKVIIELSKDFGLFKEWLDGSRNAWQPLLQEKFSVQAILDIQFTGIQKTEIHSKKQKSEVPVEVKVSSAVQHNREKQFVSKAQEPFAGNSRYNTQKINFVPIIHKNELRIDISDAKIWKKASMLLQHFPGIVTEIREK